MATHEYLMNTSDEGEEFKLMSDGRTLWWSLGVQLLTINMQVE
jgi:hypothetical protein